VANARVPFLWLCGPAGVGKSSVGYAIFQLVYRSGVKLAYVDLDQVGLCYPSPADDPHNHRVKAQNLGVVCPTYQAAGARCLIAVGAVPSREIVMTYAGKVPDADLTLCRLRAGPECLTERVFRRGLGRGPVIPGPPASNSKELLAGIAAEAIHDARDLDAADSCRNRLKGRAASRVALASSPWATRPEGAPLTGPSWRAKQSEAGEAPGVYQVVTITPGLLWPCLCY